MSSTHTPPAAHAVIMGGSSGMGRSTATLLHAAGMTVTVTGRSADKLADVQRELGITAEQVDAADRHALDDFFARQDPIDHLVVAVSGGAGAGAFCTLDLIVLRQAFAAKTFAHLDVIQSSLTRLTDHASITLITAASARAALRGTAGLAAINGALEALVGPLAGELAPIRVNAVSPGVVDTAWWHAMSESERSDMFAQVAGHLPVGHIGAPANLASAVVSLISNPFITGHVLVVDGGGHLAR